MFKTIVFLFALGSSLGEPNDRLPGDTVPLAYNLHLAPGYDAGSGAYAVGGQVEILIAVVNITPNVTLNARDLEIKSVAITELVTQTAVEVDGHDLFENEQMTVYANKNLLAGRRYQVKIVFQGPLRDDMTGLYRSAYRERNVTKYVCDFGDR